MHVLGDSHILLFLLQVSFILILAKGSGEVFRRLRQPALTAELLIGILLGPTIIGRLFPAFAALFFPSDPLQQSMLETVAWIGVLFLLLDTGLEIDFSSAWRQRGNALIIAFSDIVIPMLVAFVPALFLPDNYLVDPAKRIPFALFISVVMTISAMPVASRVMHELRILKTDLGYLTMSALAVNDIVGWALFTIIIGWFSQSSVNVGSMSLVMGATVGFSVLALTAGRYFSNRMVSWFQKKGMPEPASSFTFACVLGLVFGAFTQFLGIHALFGFFIAGIVVGEAKQLKEETRAIISQMVHSLFVPLFFVSIGLKLDFAANLDPLLLILFTVVGVMGRYVGAWIGVALSKVPKVNRSLIAIAHTPGGMMEIVVALLAHDMGLITTPVFVAIVFGAVFSSIIMGPWMRLALNRRKAVIISRYLGRDASVMVLGERDRTSAMQSLFARLETGMKNFDSKAAFKELQEREQEFSTAVGQGIAIPHVRSAAVSDPQLLIALAPHGIDWNAPDGAPVHFVAFLVSPRDSNDLHVEILSRVVKILQAPANQEALLSAADSDQSLAETLRKLCC